MCSFSDDLNAGAPKWSQRSHNDFPPRIMYVISYYNRNYNTSRKRRNVSVKFSSWPEIIYSLCAENILAKILLISNDVYFESRCDYRWLNSIFHNPCNFSILKNKLKKNIRWFERTILENQGENIVKIFLPEYSSSNVHVQELIFWYFLDDMLIYILKLFSSG